MIIELSREELKLVCDALKTEWIDWNDKAVLIEDKKVVERSMQAIDALSERLRNRLWNDLALAGMPFEEEAE